MWKGATADHSRRPNRLFGHRLTRLERLFLLGGAAMVLGLLFTLSGLVNTVELASYDLRFWLRGPRPALPVIAIVAINDESFEALNQNIRSWPRSNYADLIDAIAAGNPTLIGVDVAWSQTSPDPDQDRQLAASMQQAGNVVLASSIEQHAGTGYQYQRYLPPAPILEAAAAGVGLANMVPDNDGVLRRAYAWQLHNDTLYPTFAREVARLYLDEPAVAPDPATGEILINFRGGPASYPNYSMYQVLNGEVAPETFTGKIVLIGFTSALEKDLHLTAYNSSRGSPVLIPGVEVHANIVDTLLSGDPIRPIPGWLAILLVLAAGGLTLLAFWRLRPVLATLVVGVLMLVYLVGAFVLFFLADLWLPVAAPTGVVAVALTASLVERVMVEEQEKRRIRARFSSFMAPERLEVVLDHWEQLTAEDRPQVEASVLFTDIRHFTTATESLTQQGRSQEMIQFLNHYTDAMVDAIFAEHGVLDKMMGDGLLVLFGAPDPFPDHALRAVRSALRMEALLPELNRAWPMHSERPLQIGIGIHSGSLVDGIVGRGPRVEYTVIGDVVNTASRVQEYTKHVLRLGQNGQPGATIYITDACYQQVQDQVLVDEHQTPFKARGKMEPIQVYRVLALRDEAGEKTDEDKER